MRIQCSVWNLYFIGWWQLSEKDKECEFKDLWYCMFCLLYYKIIWKTSLIVLNESISDNHEIILHNIWLSADMGLGVWSAREDGVAFYACNVLPGASFTNMD